ncbi:MAG TPA: hypothetical protein VNS58_23830 [Puia sp.]|nr:hypothetical protein [Puia sp.]
MELFRKIYLSIGLFFVVQCCFSQLSEPVKQLIEYSKRNTPAGYSPRLNILTLTPKGNLHYLFPLYHAFKDEEKFRKIYSDKGYYDELSQYFSFAGDYLAAQQYLVKSYDSIDDANRRKIFRTVEGIKNIEHADARRYINFIAKSSRVLLLNEANSKGLHRAFALSLLSDLYRQGFRYLAMEMLNNFSNHTLSRLTLHTGYYTAEPVAGELIRSALAMGYTLVSYEDTAASTHTVGQRDSIQARNIYKVLQEDTAARILVYASYAHISKKVSADGYIPMGMAFQKLSGINPVTIDQTDMTEESNFAYGRVFWQAYVQKYPVKTASIALLNNEPVNVTGNDLYDLCVIHPPAIYQDGRPTWLTLGGLRQPFYVKPPSVNTYLVQAYYQDEIAGNDNKPWQLVPADQSYIPSGKKSYMLYLKKGKYTVLFRDIDYHIVGTLNTEVN